VRKAVLLTVTGPDRVGIVEGVTAKLLDADGNVETSRMAHLGGEFAMLMLVSVPAEKVAHLAATIGRLEDEGYKVTTTITESDESASGTPKRIYQISVEGADHEGIVHDIAAGLAHHQINIETMDTFLSPAAVSGVPLFSMCATIAVPANLDERTWSDSLKKAAAAANVDVAIVEL